MTNKRIRKKRAKAEWQRDKSKLIANFLVMMYPGRSRADYIEMSKPLCKLDKDALLSLIRETTTRMVLQMSPLRRIIPRSPNVPEMVKWRPIVSGGLDR